MNVKTTISILFATLFTLTTHAQDAGSGTQKEVGVRMNNLHNLGFTFKKQKSENKFSRLRLMSFSVETVNSSNNVGSMAFSSAFGREKRKPITDKLSFVRGWDLMAAVSASKSENVWGSFYTGLGLVLGVQYDINDHFGMNIETIPGLMGEFSFSENHVDFTGLDVGFGANKVAIGVSYKF